MSLPPFHDHELTPWADVIGLFCVLCLLGVFIIGLVEVLEYINIVIKGAA